MTDGRRHRWRYGLRSESLSARQGSTRVLASAARMGGGPWRISGPATRSTEFR
jgi:hypothetical protein